MRDKRNRAGREYEALSLLERGERLGIKVAFWNVTRKYDTDKPEHLCPWPFERAYVASDLRVVPCCIIGNPDVSEVGTADGDFTAVWTGDALREFRQAHIQGRVPAVCRSCYAAATGHQ